MVWALSKLPATQRPWTSKLRLLPDAGLLLVVLCKIGVLSEPLPLLDLSDDPEISAALDQLVHHGVIKRVDRNGPLPDGPGSVLVAVDLDQVEEPPESLTTPSTRKVKYVSWSVSRGFAKLEDSAWTSGERKAHEPLASSIVAQPEAANLMLETILCCILRIVLSSGTHETELTSGGLFNVDFMRLAPKGVVRDTTRGSKHVLRRLSSVKAPSPPALTRKSSSSVRAAGQSTVFALGALGRPGPAADPALQA